MVSESPFIDILDVRHACIRTAPKTLTTTANFNYCCKESVLNLEAENGACFSFFQPASVSGELQPRVCTRCLFGVHVWEHPMPRVRCPLLRRTSGID